MRNVTSQLLGVVLICAATTAVLAAPETALGSSINWRRDLASAQAEAQQTGKPVLIHFWTPTCGPCKRLERTVFNQGSVAEALENQFVPVKINAEAMPAVARQYAVFQWPTDVITTPQGHAIGKMISPPTPTAYISQVSQVASRFKTRLGAGFDQAVANAPQPSKLNSAYAGLSLSASPPAKVSQPRPGINPAMVANPHFAGPGPAIAPNPTPASRYQPQIQSRPNPQDRYAMAPPAAMPSSPAVNPAPVASASVEAARVALTAPPARIANPYYAQANTPAPPQTIQAQAASAKPFAQTATPPVAGPSHQQLAGSPPIAPAAPASVAPLAASNSVPQTSVPQTVPIGFDGFCPVSMKKDWRWIKGDPRWGIVHRGRTYLFNSEANRDEFWQKPDFYSPALSGNDPVLAIDRGQSLNGTREHSLEYGGQFYMFATEATLQQFSASPGRYVAGVRQAMGLDGAGSTIRR